MTEDHIQWISTTMTYHVDHLDADGNHLPLVSKPTWTIEHRPDDPNVSQGLGTLELSGDCTSAKIKTGDQPGIITVRVGAQASSTAFVSKTFIVHVKRHPPIANYETALTVTQGRNGSIHH